jgi:rhodanese-related sulfurtransferase
MAKAAELGAQPGWHSLNQYKNPANPQAHFLTTGPEIWRQTGGKITHFVAGLGTCGTITGVGRFLKSQNPDVKVYGAHPTQGHDIPGVRSRRALALTDFFKPEEYDGVFEITDEEAYSLCKRIIQEESIIAGPTSAMALAGVLKAVPDAPGNVCVVVFPDNAFKYMTSFRRHLPELFPGAAPAAPTGGAFAPQLEAVVAFAETGPNVIDALSASRLVASGATLLDVRNPDEIRRQGITGTLNVPLATLTSSPGESLPANRSAPIVTICAAGKRSLYALLLLQAQGYTDVKSVAGGIQRWAESGLPTTTG